MCPDYRKCLHFRLYSTFPLRRSTLISSVFLPIHLSIRKSRYTNLYTPEATNQLEPSSITCSTSNLLSLWLFKKIFNIVRFKDFTSGIVHILRNVFFFCLCCCILFNFTKIVFSSLFKQEKNVLRNTSTIPKQKIRDWTKKRLSRKIYNLFIIWN